MNIPAGVIGAAWEAQQKLSRGGFRFCFIGGLALQRWGEPRYTQDVELNMRESPSPPVLWRPKLVETRFVFRQRANGRAPYNRRESN